MANSLLLLVLLSSISISVLASDTSLDFPNAITSYYPSFDPSSSSDYLTVFTSASIASNGALQVTPDTLNNVEHLTHKAGQIFLSSPFRFWETTNSGTHLASFNAFFDINIRRTSDSLPGEGFAFLVKSSLEEPPLGSEDGYLGLTNSTLDGHLSNKFVAIELDTVKQSHDPDDNHVGLDINGVNSTVVNSLTPFGIEISPVNSTNYTVWIDYDGLARKIWVYMAVQGDPKPENDVLNASLDLSKVIDEVAHIGFSASTGAKYELNSVFYWWLLVQKREEQDACFSCSQEGKIVPKDRTGLSK